MGKEKLKSCPFCGTAATLSEDRWGVKVRCPSCTASIYVQKMYGKGKEHNEREKAIKIWNRRHRNLNKIVILGRLTRDPDVRYSDNPDGQLAIARFAVAVNRPARKGENEKADFISCIAFGRIAELLEKYFTKGSRILVEGRIQTGSYKNRDGQTVYTTDLYTEKIEFIDYKNDSRQSQPEDRNRQQNQGSSQAGQQNAQQAAPQNQTPPPPETYYQYEW